MSAKVSPDLFVGVFCLFQDNHFLLFVVFYSVWAVCKYLALFVRRCLAEPLEAAHSSGQDRWVCWGGGNPSHRVILEEDVLN